MKKSTEDKPGDKHVPPQQVGTEMNAVEKLELSSETEAINFFKTVKMRLLDVNRWSEVAGVPLSAFKLTDCQGHEVHRTAVEGDYLKIDIPGPGTKTGGGYDWVVIEQIREEIQDGAEILTMTVRPAANPLGEDGHTAHFLTDQATSTFQVKRIENTIYAEEHGRNETPNTDTGHVLDNIRNAFVGWAAKIGFSYPQWKSLVNGLINKE
jgi:hypothetical protein